MNSKSLTFDEFLPMLATISKQQDPGSYEDFVEVRVLQQFMVSIFFWDEDFTLNNFFRVFVCSTKKVTVL